MVRNILGKLDLINIRELCDQVLSLSEYRAQLYDYLKSRMNIIAPNLTALVGKLVGARLIAHGGSFLNLAKLPGSTVQILGAEKALFRALKTKHATPKYELIYYASLIGHPAQNFKGKISRSLAAKTTLVIMEDALGHGQHNSMGLENKAKLEARLRSLEGNELGRLAGSTRGKPKIESYDKDWKKGVGGFCQAPHGASVDEEMQELPVAEEKKEKKKEKKERSGDDDAALQADAGKESDQVETTKKEKKKKRRDSAEDGQVQAEEDYRDGELQ
ncbi:probable nucleolar protein 5-1 [Prosopis cineraria]|uniref:probable nucleolar protein 5-1 n=1 Tax=Prosopis cineraria TaxID=364024 RepID=UPI0024100C67|nr:probable nucleolar protein 5-1 [Prosopis cineraria]